MKQLDSYVAALFLMLCLIFVPANVLAQEKSNVSGKVYDENGKAISGVNVSLKGANKNVSSDENGDYKFSNITAGDYIITASNVGYKTFEKKVSLKSGESVTEDLFMEIESQGLQEVVVTGSSGPRKKLESSIAITTMGAKAIADRAPMSTADLLQVIPGFVAESSGGEVGNNLFARGIPSAGAYEYVQIQEDGLPVFEDGALQFANIDNFYRLDNSLKTMEAVRGGSASIYATGAPGGIINFISKTGQNETKGLLTLSTSDYGLMRTDFNVGGAITKDKLFFNLGSFYRQDDGIRSPGYTANRGGQIKMNLTYKFDEGFARIYYKKLNDRNIFYQLTPFVKSGSKVKEYDGFDANYGTFASSEMTHLKVPQAGGGFFQANLEDGVHPVSDAIGTEFNYNVTSKVKFKNAFRYTTIDQDYNAIYAAAWMGGIQTQSEYATSQTVDPANAQYTYVNGGGNLDPNTKLKRADLWFINKKMSNFVNNMSFTFDLDPIKLTVGDYYSNWTSKHYWNWNSFLSTVETHTRLVNLHDNSNGMDHTYNGVSQITWLEREAQLNGRVNAAFADAEIKASNDLTFNVGFRYDHDKYSGYRDHAGDNPTQNLGVLPNNTADDNVQTLQGKAYTFWKYELSQFSYSLGGNYKLNDKMATYARISHGFRAPIEESFYDAAADGDMHGLEPTKINQYELGYKGDLGNVNIYASGFLMDLTNIAYQDIVAGGVSEGKFADVRNFGLELEVAAKFDKLHLGFNGTVQNPKYRNYEGTQAYLNGNTARRIPKMYFTVRPDYDFTKQLNGYVKWSYFGKKYNDIENTYELPAFGVLDLGLSYKIKNLRFGVDGTNILNTIGLTEGDGTAPKDGETFLARSILGAAVRGSVTLEF